MPFFHSYLASQLIELFQDNQNLILASRELGKWIGENGHTLVYGGSKCGLMGELAESVLKAKGKVIGVEPQFFIDAGFDYPEITQ